MDGSLIMINRELHIESTQGQALDYFFNPGKFSFFSAKELSAGRRIEKQISAFSSGSLGVRHRSDLCQHLLTFSLHLPGELVLCQLRSGLKSQSRDRTDTGQSFASKTQTGNSLQICQFTNLTSGMPAQRQMEIFFQNPCTVVPDPDQLDATLLDIDVKTGSPRVKAILQQLLHHRGRTLYHFSSSDLVRQALT